MMNIPLSVQNRGLRLQDPFELSIFQKGKRTLKMSRTRLVIKSAEECNLDFRENIYYLPCLKNEMFQVEINLVNYENNEEEGRFLIRGLGDTFFKLNGNSCQIAFLERNDVLEIGFNKFFFKTDKSLKSEIKIPEQVVRSQLPILIEGATGTGKTRLAKLIHEESNLAGNFVHLNLSSFSSQLIESELFGHVKGAFTGATNDRKGAILEASKGTLFLDEIDSLSLDLQTKLLLFLESKEFRPVGLDRTIKAQVRILCSSGRPLKELVSLGKMRSDFYFRLNNGFKILMPKLKNNESLIEEICKNYSEEFGISIDKSLIEFYKKLTWPGNIRELRAHLNKKSILSSGKKLIIDELDTELMELNEFTKELNNKILTMNEVKLKHTLSVYHHHNQNLAITSKVLGVCPNTVRAIIGKQVA